MDIDWLLLAPAAVSCARLSGSLDGCWEDGLRGLSSFVLTQTTNTIHTQRGQEGAVQKIFLYFQSSDSERQSNTPVCDLMCSFGSVCVSVSMCFHWCLNLLYQDKVDYTNPLYCLCSFTSPPFCFHFTLFCCSLKKWGPKKDRWRIWWTFVLFLFFSNSDLNYIKIVVYLYF